MSAAKVRHVEGGRLAFWCPGCDEAHSVTVDGSRGWTWDGNDENPTITPSVLVRGGRIEFLGDCTHALAGQTVDLPVWNKEELA